jgi:hypothetical protein
MKLRCTDEPFTYQDASKDHVSREAPPKIRATFVTRRSDVPDI